MITGTIYKKKVWGLWTKYVSREIFIDFLLMTNSLPGLLMAEGCLVTLRRSDQRLSVQLLYVRLQRRMDNDWSLNYLALCVCTFWMAP